MTTHLKINKADAACGSLYLRQQLAGPELELVGPDKIVGPEDFDSIDCDGCKTTLYYAAAERIAMQRAHNGEDLIGKLLAGRERIEGPLGDPSLIVEGMTAGERIRALSAVMEPEKKAEWLHRIHDMTADTCPGCGGSIKYAEHAEDCRGPDPDKWELTDEEVTAELRVLGIDPVASAARMKAKLDQFVAAARARVKADEGHCHTCHNHERTSCGQDDCPCFSGECENWGTANGPA